MNVERVHSEVSVVLDDAIDVDEGQHEALGTAGGVLADTTRGKKKKIRFKNEQ